MDFLFFPRRVAVSRLELRSHCLFCQREGVHGKPWERGFLIYDFALILLKPAIILVSVSKKTARSWVGKC